jgi:hypothetical protein
MAALATDPQINLIVKLSQEQGVEQPALAGMTKTQASQVITNLIEAGKAAAKPKLSLTEMAAAIEAPAVVEDEAQIATLAITAAEAKLLLGWKQVYEAELSPEEEDEALEQRIRAFMEAKPAAAPKGFTPTAAEPVPAGHYAIGPEGDTKFYRVQYGKAGGKWEGFLFIDVQASDDYHPVKDTAVKGAIIDAIKKQGILASTQRYGHELGVCGVCHKTLTDPQSIADGIGPVCQSKLGL